MRGFTLCVIGFCKKKKSALVWILGNFSEMVWLLTISQMEVNLGFRQKRTMKSYKAQDTSKEITKNSRQFTRNGKKKHIQEMNEKAPSVFNLWQGGKSKSNVLEYAKDNDGYHPTQKPVKLLEDLIQTYSNEGNTVLDFTMGSGSTGVACVNTNRNFIGIELDEHYFEVAKNRIYDTVKNKEQAS